MADQGFPRRVAKLAAMLRWAVFDGRFEPEDKQRIPLVRALRFAWASANVFGDFGVRRLPCGCQTRFGRPLVFCSRHVFGDDWPSVSGDPTS